MENSANLNLMLRAARKAGRVLARDFGEVSNLQASIKSAGDFVSKADLASERILREELMEGRPNYGFLAEEGGEIPGKDPTRRWIVDPLDGTTNFLHGLPHWAISIALEHKKIVIAGVIFDPFKEEMYFAEKGAGAWMNNRRIRVSARSRMSESVFATGIPFGPQNHLPKSLDELGRLSPLTAGVRRWGAAALDMAYVAAGRYEGFWERGLNAWDLAAGIAIIREAGGLVEPIEPDHSILGDGEVICANGLIFEDFAKVIRGK